MNRELNFSHCINVRDFGGLPTSAGVMHWRRLIRADSLYKLTPEGVDDLVEYGVSTVIDLRYAHELVATPNPFAAGVSGVQFVHAPLLSGESDRDHPRLQPGPNSPHWNITILEDCAENLANVMRAIAHAPDGAVLFHCHVGKDRTGLIALILQSLVGVPTQIIMDDYLLSNKNLQPIYDEIIARYQNDALELARVKSVLSARAETATGTLHYLEAQHDGAKNYLRQIGLSEAELRALRDRMTKE